METSNKLDRRMMVGLLLILGGGLLLLDTFGLIDVNLRHYLINWKTLLIIIGLITLTSKGNQTTGWVLIGLGVFFWIPELFDYRLRLRDILWPAILIGTGLLILTRNDRKFNKQVEDAGEYFRNNFHQGESDQEFFNETVVFGGGNIRLISDNFRGGKLTNILGGSDINLIKATPSPQGCVIDVVVIFGGSNLVLPDDWQIKTEAVSIFGGVSDKRVMPAAFNPDKTLVIKGVVIFGGIEIKSY
jgi:predicted membrane protein